MVEEEGGGWRNSTYMVEVFAQCIRIPDNLEDDQVVGSMAHRPPLPPPECCKVLRAVHCDLLAQRSSADFPHTTEVQLIKGRGEGNGEILHHQNYIIIIICKSDQMKVLSTKSKFRHDNHTWKGLRLCTMHCSLLEGGRKDRGS